MQLSDQSAVTGISVIARRASASRLVLLFIWAPIALIGISATASAAYRLIVKHYNADDRLGNLTQRQAEGLARDICGRLTQEPAEAIATFGYSNKPHDNRPASQEWHVTCRTTRTHQRFFLRIDADTSELLMARRERRQGGAEARSNGDLRGVTDAEALSYARHYLDAVGLSALRESPVRRDTESEIVFNAPAPPGRRRLLRVRVDRTDGTFDHLQNVVYRSFSPIR